jgi:hypothetical protein
MRLQSFHTANIHVAAQLLAAAAAPHATHSAQQGSGPCLATPAQQQLLL